MAVVSRLSPVANDVHPANHLADGEETNDLRSGDTSKGDFLLVGITDSREDVLRRRDVETPERGGIAEGNHEGLEVRLECGHAPGMRDCQLAQTRSLFLRDSRLLMATMATLTGATCSGRGKPIWRAQSRPSSSTRWGVSVLDSE